MDENIAKLYKRIDGKGQAICAAFLEKNFTPIYPFNHPSYHRVDLDNSTPSIEIETGQVKEYIINVFYVGTNILSIHTCGILIPVPQAIQTGLFVRIHEYFDAVDIVTMEINLRKYLKYVFNVMPRAHRHNIPELLEYKRIHEVIEADNEALRGRIGLYPISELLKEIYVGLIP